MMEVVNGFQFDIWSQGIHVTTAFSLGRRTAIVHVSVLQLVGLGASTRNMMDASLTQSDCRGHYGGRTSFENHPSRFESHFYLNVKCGRIGPIPCTYYSCLLDRTVRIGPLFVKVYLLLKF